MRLLLDTHVLIWALSDPGQLCDRWREEIAAPANNVFVSAASLWEISIKQALGKLSLPAPADPWLLDAVDDIGFTVVGIDGRHAVAAGHLPLFHRDPFDRMLIAQARLERLILVTVDARIPLYDIPILDRR